MIPAELLLFICVARYDLQHIRLPTCFAVYEYKTTSHRSTIFTNTQSIEESISPVAEANIDVRHKRPSAGPFLEATVEIHRFPHCIFVRGIIKISRPYVHELMNVNQIILIAIDEGKRLQQ